MADWQLLITGYGPRDDAVQEADGRKMRDPASCSDGSSCTLPHVVSATIVAVSMEVINDFSYHVCMAETVYMPTILVFFLENEPAGWRSRESLRIAIVHDSHEVDFRVPVGIWAQSHRYLWRNKAI